MAHTVDDVLCIRETDKAVLVELCSHGGREVWVPKRVIDRESAVRGETPSFRGPGKLVVRSWFAEREQLP